MLASQIKGSISDFSILNKEKGHYFIFVISKADLVSLTLVYLKCKFKLNFKTKQQEKEKLEWIGLDLFR